MLNKRRGDKLEPR